MKYWRAGFVSVLLVTWFMLDQHLLPLDFYLNSGFKDRESAVTCSVCFLGLLPYLKIKPVFPPPSQPVDFFKTGCAHCISSHPLFWAATVCSLTYFQSLSLSEACQHELSSLKRKPIHCIPGFYKRSEMRHNRHL